MQTGTLLIDSALYDSCCSFWDAYVAEACRCARRRRPLRRPPSPDAPPRRPPLRTASVQPRLQHAPPPFPPPPTGPPSLATVPRSPRRRGPPPQPVRGRFSQDTWPNYVYGPGAASVSTVRSRGSRRRSASVPSTQPRCRCVRRRLAPCVRRHAAAATTASGRTSPPSDPGAPSSSSNRRTPPPATRAIPAPVPALAAAAAAPLLSPRGRSTTATHAAPMNINTGSNPGVGAATAQGDDGPYRWTSVRGGTAAFSMAPSGGGGGGGGGRRGPRGQRGRRDRTQRWRRGQHRFDGGPPPPLPMAHVGRPVRALRAQMLPFAPNNGHRDALLRPYPYHHPPTFEWTGASCYPYEEAVPPDAPFYFFPCWPNIALPPYDPFMCLDQQLSMDIMRAEAAKMEVEMMQPLHALPPPQPATAPLSPRGQDHHLGFGGPPAVSTVVANVTFRIAHLAEFFSDPFKEELFLELADAARGECECFEVVEFSDQQKSNKQRHCDRDDDLGVEEEPMQVDGTLIQHIVQEDVLKNFIRNLEEENNNNAKNVAASEAQRCCDPKNGFYTDYGDPEYQWYQPNAFKKSENGSSGWDYRFTYTPTESMNGVFMVDSMNYHQDIWLKQ